MPFNPLEHPILFSIPRRLIPLSFWHEHIPFAMLLVDLLKPEVIVELGSQYGDSYCAFCQSVQELHLATRCYAIDNWQGDPHVGSYGPEVLADLQAHHDPLYGGFSRLMQSTFDDALQHFTDGIIDLMHIDGYHVYEAVRHDFESWLPKMSDRGVVLFHDTNVKERDFGVWKLWQELRHQYPYFEFLHGSGLGVLAVGKKFPMAFQEFLDASLEDTAKLREFFFQVGLRLTLEAQRRNHQKVLAEKEQQLTQTVAREGEQQLAQARAESARLVQEAAGYQGLITERERQLTQARTECARLGQEAAEHQALIKDQHALLLEIRQDVDGLQRCIGQESEALARKDAEFNEVDAERKRLGQELSQIVIMHEQSLQQVAEQEALLLRIYESHGWKALSWYYKFRNSILPQESSRRLFAKKIFHALLGLTGGSQPPKSFFFNGSESLIEKTEPVKVGLQSQQGSVVQDYAITEPQNSKPLEASDIALPLARSTPSVSIIIPVYNQIDLTLRCLKSIQDNPSKASAEIIVLDDTSIDETPKVLPSIPGIRHIRNDVNLGFLRSCNRAAAEARGEYLVFLNNDTQVQEDWLDNMLAVFDRFDRAGLVGAKLVYPDGRLQEAGGIVWSDGSAMNFGRDDDPKKPEYNYIRETDYCSAACIMIKASLFHDLNGFDELFAPAYYEDTDLAFKVRQKGYKVISQPASRVTHFEGGTCGTDLTSGVKSYQQVNAKKFAAKWAHVLPEHCSPQNQDLVLARDRRVIGRCLMIDYWPTPDRDSGSIDLVNKIRLFQHFSYKVTFFPYTTTRHYGRYTERLQQMGVECLYEPFFTTLADYLEPNGRYFDLVILCRAPCAISNFDTVRRYCPNAKIIFDTVDLHFLRQERAARVKNSDSDLEESRQLKRDELEIAKKADCTLVVSQAEASLLKQEIPEAFVDWFPFVRDIPGRTKGFDRRRNIAFIGGYAHEPNVDAINYFVKDIWPYIAERLDGVQLLIVGSNMPISLHLLADDRVRAIGYVEDLTQFLENCRLTIAPLRYGAGIKGKVATSLAHGVPVIASPIAAEGMSCENGKHLLVAETTAQWIDTVVRAYTDETSWRYLSDNGLTLVRELCSMEAGLARLQSLLDRLGCPGSNGFRKREDAALSRCEVSNNGSEITVFDDTNADKIGAKSFNSETDKVRAIAFYLPQYHPIPENDRWWGKGFTEWTYVTRAKPLFPDHYQPHLPSELGFYDLRLEEAREAQAELAREHGVYGFCYHYYWFGGKRLLDRPLTEMLASRRPDFPFCICWANENWTRRWDGRDQDILFKQEYSPEGDLAFIRELLPVLSDRRYIRVNGKPVLLVYRTESLPNSKKTAEIWREESIRAGIGDLYLCRVESFAAVDPKTIGFDAACQFPPLLIGSPELDSVSIFNGTNASAFDGKMFDYPGLAQRALNSQVEYKRFLGVTPSWDNTPRTGQRGYMWLNSSPEEYERWFAGALRNTVRLYRGEERLIFINAWNEWGEGCHLEPDQRYGRAFLQATRRALEATNKLPASEIPRAMQNYSS